MSDSLTKLSFRTLLLSEAFKNLFTAEEKQLYADEVWNILQTAYSGIGGIRGSGFESKESMIRTIPMWKLLIKDGAIKSVVLYKDSGGRKMVALATDGTTEGKRWLVNILNKEFERSYAEVSDALMRFMKRNLPEVVDKYQIKSSEVSAILNKEITPVDEYHYTPKYRRRQSCKDDARNTKAPYQTINIYMFKSFLLEENTDYSVLDLQTLCEDDGFKTKRNRLFSKLVDKKRKGTYESQLAFESIVNLVQGVATSHSVKSIEVVAEQIINLIEVDENDELARLMSTSDDKSRTYILSKSDVEYLFPEVAEIMSRLDEYLLTIVVSNEGVGVSIDEVKDDTTEPHSSTKADGSSPTTDHIRKVHHMVMSDAKIARLLRIMSNEA